MDRRESIKSLLLGSVAGGLLLNSCDEPAEKVTEKIWEYQYGRNKKEAAIDKVLLEYSIEQYGMEMHLKATKIKPHNNIKSYNMDEGFIFLESKKYLNEIKSMLSIFSCND